MQIVHLRKYFDTSESECGLKSSKIHTNNWDLVTCQKCKIKMEKLRALQIKNTGTVTKYKKSDFHFGDYLPKDEHNPPKFGQSDL
jgi:thymidylate synthase